MVPRTVGILLSHFSFFLLLRGFRTNYFFAGGSVGRFPQNIIPLQRLNVVIAYGRCVFLPRVACEDVETWIGGRSSVRQNEKARNLAVRRIHERKK